MGGGEFDSGLGLDAVRVEQAVRDDDRNAIQFRRHGRINILRSAAACAQLSAAAFGHEPHVRLDAGWKKIESGAAVPNRDKVGKVTKKQLLEIVELKKKDLNAVNPDNAARMIAGTARSMGIEVVG